MIEEHIVQVIFSFVALFIDVAILIVAMASKYLRSGNHDKLFMNLLASYSVFSALTCIGILCRIDLRDYVCLVVAVSVLALAFLTLDRMLVIKLPYRYHRLNSNIVYIEIATCWIIPTVYYVISTKIFTGSKLKTRALILIFIPLGGIGILIVSNMIVFLEAFRQLQKIMKTSVRPNNMKSETSTSNSTVTDNSAGISKSDGHKDSKDIAVINNEKVGRQQPPIMSMSKLRREMKLLYSCFQMVLLFAVTWLPLTVYLLVNMKTGRMPGRTYLLRVLVYVNAILTPLIYIYHSKKIKRHVRKKFLGK